MPSPTPHWLSSPRAELNIPAKTGREHPIGVFDSGIGGLTVVKQLMALLPNESIIYFGDTARIPYGTKSVEIVKRFALEDSTFLLDKQVKMIIVACNTASALAIRFLSSILPIPVTGVIRPGARAAVQQTENGRIGVIGTTATMRSNAYAREVYQLNRELKVLSQPCPLFVPLVEEGWIEDEATEMIARRYLQPMLENQVDTLVLGCTHYPLLKPMLSRIMGEQVALIDSGVETARAVQDFLSANQLTASKEAHPEHRFFLSDLPYKFQEIGERFLERSLPHVETINFENYIVQKGKSFWKEFESELQKLP